MPPVEKRLDKLIVWKQRVHQRLTYQEIATLHGVSPQAVHQACQSLESLIPDPEEAKAYEGVRADLLNAVEQRLVSSLLEPARLEKASLNNVAYTFSQIHTARRLETGQSTSNLSVLSKFIESADAKLHPTQAKQSSESTSCIETLPQPTDK